MPPDTFRDIVEQKALPISEICVAFPLNNQWHLEEVATHDKMKRFIANPPLSPLNDSWGKKKIIRYFSCADEQEVSRRLQL